jgi:hypothetical protein
VVCSILCIFDPCRLFCSLMTVNQNEVVLIDDDFQSLKGWITTRTLVIFKSCTCGKSMPLINIRVALHSCATSRSNFYTTTGLHEAKLIFETAGFCKDQILIRTQFSRSVMPLLPGKTSLCSYSTILRAVLTFCPSLLFHSIFSLYVWTRTWSGPPAAHNVQGI